jgi:hypothetical protein
MPFTGRRFLALSLAIMSFASCVLRAEPTPSQSLSGTLVVAVPVTDGLVVCSDKRLYNADAKTYTDTAVKIRQAGRNALFVATNTVAFYDARTRSTAFDASDVIAAYLTGHDLSRGMAFWDGLKNEIADRLREYLFKRKFDEWPASDKKNNNLLFNLVFYSVSQNEVHSHSLEVFYEKARTPVIYFSGPATEKVRFPKLSGKGREVMSRLAMDPALSRDPAILRFDEVRFDPAITSEADAVAFAGRLFVFANATIPDAQVSAAFDCSSLSYSNGFRWLKAN